MQWALGGLWAVYGLLSEVLGSGRAAANEIGE